MRSHLLPALVAALAIPVAARAADQFDLVCRGQLVDEGGASNAEQRYRIDLASRRWCDHRCAETRPIVSVTKDKIVLRSGGTRGTLGSVNSEEYIDRKNNRVYDFEAGPHFGSTFKGVCVVAPFSGFATPPP
jgi:hypothetical protein